MSLHIIAEIGQGFEGNFEQAKQMVRAAAAAEANSVKFQLVISDELATPDYEYYKLFKTLELTVSQWRLIRETARELSIEFYVDVFGMESVGLAAEIDCDAIKIHATDIANPNLLNEVAQCKIGSVVLGAGGAYDNEIRNAINILAKKDIVILFGFQSYPTPNDANQIVRIRHLIEQYRDLAPRLRFGFADHATPSLTTAFSAAAIGAGAQVLEKHLTLGRNMKIEDYESAINPDEFAVFTQSMRECHAAYGMFDLTNDFGMGQPERDYRKMIRRHVVSAHDLKKGTTLTASDLILKRSNIEDPITSVSQAIGKKLSTNIRENTPISSSVLKESE